MRRALVLVAVLGGEARADDVQQWTEVGLDREVAEDVTLGFDQHVRFDENVSRVESVMPEVGVDYRPKKWVRVGLGYRLQYMRNGDGEMVVRHRFHGYGRVRYDLGDVRFEYRLKLQEQLRPDDNDPSRHTMRNRGEVSYQGHKRWTPGVSAEMFHAVADEASPFYLDKVRLIAGIEYDRKAWAVDVWYAAELPVADTTEPTLHILGLGLHYDL